MKTLYIVPHNAKKIVEITDDYSFTGNIVFYGPNDGWPSHRYALPPKSGKPEYGTYFDTFAEAERYRVAMQQGSTSASGRSPRFVTSTRPS